MDWKQVYESKLVSVEEAASKIESGDRAWFGAMAGDPIQLLEAIGDRVDELENVTLATGLSLYPHNFYKSPKYKGKINFNTVFYGPYARSFFKAGNININPINLSKVDRYIKDVLKPNVLLADVSLPDEEGYFYYGATGGCANCYAAEVADKIIIQVNKHQPQTNGIKQKIHVSEVTYICEYDHELPAFPQPNISERDKKIASYIIPEIPNEATIQIGVGGLANAIGYGLENKKNLSVQTEMFTDSMLHLVKKEVIDGKIVAAFGLGSKEVYDYMGKGKVQMAPLPIANDPYDVGKNDNFISINASIMVDLTGQVCSESIGFRQYSSTGGQLDFVRGAGISKGGKSFICLPSTVKDKSGELKSTITAILPPGQVVTVPRTDTMYVVTEYGIADVWQKSIEERVNALISIAHPDFRLELRKQAIKSGLIRE